MIGLNLTFSTCSSLPSRLACTAECIDLNNTDSIVLTRKACTFIDIYRNATDQITDETKDGNIFIPPNIIPGKFTPFVLDNLDFSESTSDGSRVFEYIKKTLVAKGLDKPKITHDLPYRPPKDLSWTSLFLFQGPDFYLRQSSCEPS